MSDYVRFNLLARMLDAGSTYLPINVKKNVFFQVP